MRWSDLRAFIRYLPATSHFRREEEPEEAFKVAWIEGIATPQMVLLGELFDLLHADLYLQRGQQPPPGTILDRLAQRGEAPAGEPAEQTPVQQARPVQRARKSAAQIRAQLERASNKT